MFPQNICALQSSIMNGSCIRIPTLKVAKEGVAYERKGQELFMTLMESVLTIMSTGMDASVR